MRKIFIGIFLLTGFAFNAQNYGAINDILTLLEEKRGINQNLENLSVDNRKFVLIKDFPDHTERNFIVIKGKDATYVEMFDDKSTGETSSNVFSGDILRKQKNSDSRYQNFTSYQTKRNSLSYRHQFP